MTTSLMSSPRDAIYFGSRDAVVCSKRRSWLVRARLRVDVSQFGAGGGLVQFPRRISWKSAGRSRFRRQIISTIKL
jgi:hypothetical protein